MASKIPVPLKTESNSGLAQSDASPKTKQMFEEDLEIVNTANEQHSTEKMMEVQSDASPNTKQIFEGVLEIVNTANEQHISTEKMIEALAKIALEIHGFEHGDTSDDFSSSTTKNNVYKSKLKYKRRQIKSLKENLNAACMVAKTLTASKERECNSIHEHLNVTRIEALNLYKKNAEHLETIQILQKEKRAFTSKFRHLKNFIELGYKELQNIRKEKLQDLPLELQLKEIIMSCGQYYADFCNEREKCNQLEQKIRFLSNKLNIVERNLGSPGEVKRHQNYEINKSNVAFGCVRSECKLGMLPHELNVVPLAVEPRSYTFSPRKSSSIDLSAHLSLVKDLMKDQNNMLNELKHISKELYE